MVKNLSQETAGGGRVAGYFRRRFLGLGMVLTWVALLLQLPVTWWAWELGRHFSMFLLAGLVVTGMAAVCYRAWGHLLRCFCMAGVLFWQLQPFYPINLTAATAVPGSGEVRLITYNLLLLGREQEKTRAALEAADADLLLLLEFTPEWERALAPVLGNYQWQVKRVKGDPMGIWFGSKRPMREGRIEEVGGPGFPTVVAQVEVGGKWVGFVGAHPMNPVLPKWSAIWREQFSVYPGLLRGMGTRDYVLAGDLNCTPFARTFQTFVREAGVRDSAEGMGLLNTWSPGMRLSWFIGLPIDHVLVSRGVRVLERKPGPRLGSDHRWVEVRLGVD